MSNFAKLLPNQATPCSTEGVGRLRGIAPHSLFLLAATTLASLVRPLSGLCGHGPAHGLKPHNGPDHEVTPPCRWITPSASSLPMYMRLQSRCNANADALTVAAPLATGAGCRCNSAGGVSDQAGWSKSAPTNPSAGGPEATFRSRIIP